MISKNSALFILLCVGMASSKYSSITMQQKIVDRILFDSKSLVKSSFLYGLCNNPNERNSTCNIVLKYIDLDLYKSNKELSCPVDIAFDANYNTRITLYKIVRVGEDKAVVLCKEEEIHKPENNVIPEIDSDYDYPPEFYASPDYDFRPENNLESEKNTTLKGISEFKMINIDLTNCRTNTNKISLPISLTENTTVGILPYENTYDIVITDQLLYNTTLYKGTYNLEGATVKEMSIWGPFYTNNKNMYKLCKQQKRLLREQIYQPAGITNSSEQLWCKVEQHNKNIGYGNVKHHSSDQGYLIFNSISENAQQSFITITATLVNQETKTLKSWNVNKHKTHDVIYSTSHDMIGICLIYGKNTAICSFFDIKGAIHQETVVKLEDAYILAMHNLPNGFLLFTEECFDCDEFPLPSFHPGNYQYAVTRFNFKGEAIMKTSLPDSEWLKSLHSWTYFFENEAQENCITFLSLKNIPPFVPYINQHDTLEVIVKCFPDQ